MSARRTARPEPDVAARARARRARLAWFAGVVPVALVLVWLGLPAAVAQWRVHVAREQVAAGRVDAAYRTVSQVAGHDVVEQWRADYDLGTIRLLGGQGWLGVTPLERARRGAPEAYRCQVQTNLALAFDATQSHDTALAALDTAWAADLDAGKPVPADADGLTAAGLRARAGQRTDAAAAAGRSAARLRGDDRCSSGSPTPPPPPSLPPSSQPTASPSSSDGSGQAEPQRQQELQGRQDQAQSDAEKQRQTGQGGLGVADDGQTPSPGGSTPNW